MRRLRERRAAALPIDGEPPRLRDELLLPAVEETLAALKLGESDRSATQLARRYAKVIDEARDPAWSLRHETPLDVGGMSGALGRPQRGAMRHRWMCALYPRSTEWRGPPGRVNARWLNPLRGPRVAEQARGGRDRPPPRLAPTRGT
jgi:hypothetical protein